ncbi:class I SAM-dependent methyltransferase [Streptomyces sp. Tu 2975]|uniref:class I SAM-dependent DNA methyltransferase n=1 Tax=Streptomyces sp. Tu 2975 TaxID=2676871 RepID=UPI001FCA3A74|nr:class I SAM-dependent methyltransferase [Streptomyces sp. Tu 2975]
MTNGNSDADYEGLPPDRRDQAEAFDAIGDSYDDAFPHKEGQVSAGEWLAEALSPGARVLDLGCGTGVPTAQRLADAGLEVVGVDLSKEMVGLARANVPHGTFHRLDIADLRPDGPTDLGRFDAVTAFFSLLMLPRAEIPEALRTVHHLLVPGGVFVLSMVEADMDNRAIPFLGKSIRVSGYLREELHKVVEQDFEILKESSYTYAPAVSDVPPEEQVFLRCRRRD